MSVVLPIIKRYYSDNKPLYDVLMEHSEQVRDRALRIVDSHPQWPLDREFISEASLLHDIGIFLCDAPPIHCYGTHLYIEHGYLGGQLLRQEGLSEEYALVAERHTGTGLTCDQIVANNYPIPQRDYLPVSLAEQVICYADKFYSKTHLGEEIPYEVVYSKIGRWGQQCQTKMSRWHKLFEE